MKKMVSVMLETALAIALACVGIGAARTAASAEEGKLTLLGDTDTYEESHWQDYLPAPEAVQGDNQWTVYAGTVEGTRIECTLQNGGVWLRTIRGAAPITEDISTVRAASARWRAGRRPRTER